MVMNSKRSSSSQGIVLGHFVGVYHTIARSRFQRATNSKSRDSAMLLPFLVRAEADSSVDS